MHLAVEDILELPILKTATVKTGSNVLRHRHVEWVSVIEGTVEDFVRQNEFILTIGMGFENTPEQLLEFVKDIYESGASALAIATGRYIFEIPDNVLQYTRQQQFVLIEIPWEIRFADIQRTVMMKLNEWQDDISRHSRRIQKRLIDLVVQGKDLSDIVKYAERTLGWSIVFRDEKGRIKPNTENALDMTRLWANLESRDGTHIEEPVSHHIEKMVVNECHLIKKSISAGGLDRGSFIILLPKGVRVTGNVLHILEYLSAAAALWSSREDAIIKTENRLRNDFIWNLAKTPGYVTDHIRNRAKIFGYNLYLSYVCIVGLPENIDDLSEDRYQDTQYGLQSLIYYMEEEIRYASQVVEKQVAFTFDEDLLIIYLEADDDTLQGTVHYYLDLVEKRLNAIIPGVICSWGIGKHEDGVMVFNESFKKARSALDMGRQQKGQGQRVHYEDTQLNRLMLSLAHHDEIQDIMFTTISPLIEYDREREANLIQTFNVYANQNSNVSRSARLLNLHRQSLLYRLRKIETLTGLSLVNPDDIFLLQFSVKLWQTGVWKNKLFND
ncbi:PucR family transcriptional regulator [Lentibacillus saliphilus]|uniref:PucR family transcriptional regulator n=1 Tax=Lentibacillus saliphilus TaxID=2737028 RepID=UPI001C3027AC|nr:PucR family transcriptional regulator [Lentibacillus saliphilus]